MADIVRRRGPRRTTLIDSIRRFRTVRLGSIENSKSIGSASSVSLTHTSPFRSTFPDPIKAERRQYAVYWQKKLAENERIKFPNKLLDDFAAKTDGFSFAYMKEAL